MIRMWRDPDLNRNNITGLVPAPEAPQNIRVEALIGAGKQGIALSGGMP
jgi:hypothetical protein